MHTIADEAPPRWDRQGLDHLALLDQWHVVARARDIAPGATVQVTLLGQDLLIWRAAGGELQAWAGRRSRANGPLLALPVHLPPGLPARHQRDGQAYAVCEGSALVWVCMGRAPAGPPLLADWGVAHGENVIARPVSYRANALRCMDHFLHDSPAAAAQAGAGLDALPGASAAYRVEAGPAGLCTSPFAIVLREEEAEEHGEVCVLARYHCLSPTLACIEKGLGGPRPWFVWCAWTPVALDRAQLWLVMGLPPGIVAPERLIWEQQELVLPEDERWLVESLRPFQLPLGVADEAETLGSPLSLAYRRWVRDLGLRRLAAERPVAGLDLVLL